MSLRDDHDQTAAIAAAMAEPDFYPDRPGRVEVCETHISWVFLAGDRAFKLRKPVLFPFLDYSTPERRRQMAEEEIRLGRRLAPTLYVGLRSIVGRDGGFALGGPDDRAATERVVEMRRFDERRTLAALLETRGDAQRHVGEIARHIARFHAGADPAPQDSPGAGRVARTVSDNLANLVDHAEVVGPARLAAAHRFTVAFVHARRAQLDARAAGGHVRDCHGDLRAEHVLLGEHGVEIFDPVEFDPRLRLIDTSSDLAFLVMELTEAGRDGLVELLLRAYRDAGGDDGGESLLGFYATYRAWVRAKVACLRAVELAPGQARDREQDHARRLALLAERLAWRARGPVVIVVCGAAATGKTRVAEHLPATGAPPHLNSDVVRKQLSGLDPSARAPLSAYSEQASLDTYRELGIRAAAEPRGAVVDATFRRRAHRDAFAAGLGATAPAALFVECRAPTAVIAERARRREREPGHVSDATAAIATGQLAEFEPLDEVDPDRHLIVRSDRELGATIDEILGRLDADLARPG